MVLLTSVFRSNTRLSTQLIIPHQGLPPSSRWRTGWGTIGVSNAYGCVSLARSRLFCILMWAARQLLLQVQSSEHNEKHLRCHHSTNRRTLHTLPDSDVITMLRKVSSGPRHIMQYPKEFYKISRYAIDARQTVACRVPSDEVANTQGKPPKSSFREKRYFAVISWIIFTREHEQTIVQDLSKHYLTQRKSP